MLTGDNIVDIISFFKKKGGNSAQLSFIYERLKNGNELDSLYKDKIINIINNIYKEERNLSAEVRLWIESTEGGVFTNDKCYRDLGAINKKEKDTIRTVLRNLCKEKFIEKYGTISGTYRMVNTDVDIIDWKNADEKEYIMRWPLQIENLVKLYPGNIAILAGASNVGKTSFMLELIRLNQFVHPVVYFNSEMAASEMKLRLKMFHEDMCKFDDWKFKAIERSSNFADVIEPDSFNIVDFMEVYDDFWKVGGWIRDIHARLKSGICVIAIQKKSSTKKEQQRYGRGGELTIEKPRLYLAMDRGRIEIIKAKIWRSHERNPNGLARRFKLVGGYKFLPQDDWYEAEEERYEGFSKE